MANTGWKYAQTVNEQVNPNTTHRNHWSNMANAVGNSTKYASAQFTKTTKTSNYPYTVTAHDFKLNIPSTAYIDKVEIEVRMKSSISSKSVLCKH